MERSPSRAHKSSSARQGLSRICKDENPIQSSHMQPLAPIKARWIQPTISSFSLKLILILYFHLHLGFPTRLSPLGDFIKIIHPLLFFTMRVTCTAYIPLLASNSWMKFLWGIQIIKLFLAQFSSVPCYFLPCMLIYVQSEHTPRFCCDTSRRTKKWKRKRHKPWLAVTFVRIR